MAVHFPIGIQARFEESQAVGGKGRIIGNEKMIQLSIQIHPHRSPQQLDLSSLRAECDRLAADEALVRQFSWSEGFDEHAYLNLTFETDRPGPFWGLLHQQIYQASRFSSFMQVSSMATCEGQHG